MTESRRGRGLGVLVAACLAVVVGAGAGGAAAAGGCAITPPPSPFFGVTLTGVTCAKAKTVAKAWDGKAECHAVVDNVSCDVKGYACRSRIANPTGATYEKVTCKKGAKRIKFSYGTG